MWRSPATFLVDFDIKKIYVPLKIAFAFAPDIVAWALGLVVESSRKPVSEVKEVRNGVQA